MKRFAIILLAVLLFTSLTPNSAIALSVPVHDSYCFTHNVYSNMNAIDTEYLESIGFMPSKYGTGCIPLVIESYEELDKIFPPPAPNYTGGTLAPGERNPFFFDEHYIVLIYAWSPTPGYKYKVDRVYYDNETTYIEYTCTIPDGSFPDEVQYDIIEITLLRENAPKNIKNIELSANFKYENSLTPAFTIIELSTENLKVDIDPNNYYGKNAIPTLVTSADELEDVAISGVDENTFDGLIRDSELFFEYYDLLLFTAYSPSQTVKYDITHIYLNNDGDDNSKMYVYASYDNSNAFDLATQYTLIALLIAKDISSLADSFEIIMTAGVRLGDVDGNGFIEVYDYIYAKRHYFGTFTLDDEQFNRADVNRDGVVDQYDYILIKRIYFGTYTAD